jgi:hypothetical protein
VKKTLSIDMGSLSPDCKPSGLCRRETNKQTINLYTPRRTLKGKCQPWVNATTLEAIKFKRLSFREFKAGKTTSENFKKIRNWAASVVRRSKDNFERLTLNPKAFWRIIKMASKTRSKVQQLVDPVPGDSSKCATEAANILNVLTLLINC